MLRSFIPVAALIYPLIIQPLLEWRTRVDDSLDLTTNVRNADANPLNQAYWLGLLVLAIWAFRREIARLRFVLAQPPVLLVGAYLVFAACSVAWSPVPAISGRRVILQTVVVLVSLIVPQLVERPSSVLIGCVRAFAGAAFINAPVALLSPPGRLGGALGIYGNKNILGLVMALAIMFLVYGITTARNWGERAFYLLAMGAAGVALILSRADTSVLLAIGLPCVVAIVFLVARLLRLRPTLVLAVLAVATTCVALLYGAAGGDTSGLLELVFGDPSLSGRTEIWAFALRASADMSAFGHGYASFWGAGENSYVDELAPGFIAGLNQAHNGYIDVLLETGFFGLGLLILVLVSGLSPLDRSHAGDDRAMQRLVLTVMLFAFFHNGLESSWFRGFSTLWVTYLIILGVVLNRRAVARTARRGHLWPDNVAEPELMLRPALVDRKD